MKQWGLVVMIAISLLVMPTAALELEVSTTIPEYIMVDYLNLTGSYATTVDGFVDDGSDDFSLGSSRNLTVLADSLELKPSLDVTMLNAGHILGRRQFGLGLPPLGLRRDQGQWDIHPLLCRGQVPDHVYRQGHRVRHEH